MLLLTILLSVVTFAKTYNPRNGVTDSSLISSYDTTYTEKGNVYRQIYICNRTEKTETFILIKNDSILLWDVDKIK